MKVVDFDQRLGCRKNYFGGAMRIGFVLIGENRNLALFSDILEKKLVEVGHTIKRFSTEKDDLEKLYLEKHVVFFVDSGKWFRKGNSLSALEFFLKNKGEILTKYASLYVTYKPFCNSFFLKAMVLLENHGFVLQDTDIIKDITEMDVAAQYFCPAG